MGIFHNSIAHDILRSNSREKHNITVSQEEVSVEEDDKATSLFDSFDDLDDDTDEEIDFRNEENLEDYQYGGYHPAKIGDICGDQQQYQIVRKLGWGHFSTVWLAFNTVTKTYVALKIIKSEEKYKTAAIDEIKLLQKASKGSENHPGKKHVVKLLDYFLLAGPNGDHICMIFELLGENMLSLIRKFRDLHCQYTELSELNNEKKDSIKKSSLSLNDSMSFGEASTNLFVLDKIFKDYYGGLPLSLVKRISRQILLALDYLHRECGLIHTDLKPENILIEIKNVDKVVDLVRQEEKMIRFNKRKDSSKSILRKDSSVSIASSSNLLRMTSNTEFSKSIPINQKGLSIITTNLPSSSSSSSQDNLLTTPTRRNTTPIRCSKPLPSPILRKSSIWSCCYGEDQSRVSTANSSNDNSDTSLFDKFHFAGETVESSFAKLGIKEPVHDKRNQNPFDIDTVNLRNLSHLEDEFDELDENITVKIADLGNSCFVDNHFTEAIQTREYRSPEVIVGGKWGCSADIWSAGCVIFELITGKFAFNPKTRSGQERSYKHLAKIVSMCLDEKNYFQERQCYDYYDDNFFNSDGDFIMPNPDSLPPAPKGFDLRKIMNTRSQRFFNSRKNKCGPFIFPYELYKKSRKGPKFFDSMVTRIHKVKPIKFKSLFDVLIEYYHLPKHEAEQISDFLMRMLEMHPKYREDAGGLTNHPWLKIYTGNGNYYEDDKIDRPLGGIGDDILGWCYEVKEEYDCLSEYDFSEFEEIDNGQFDMIFRVQDKEDYAYYSR